MAFNYSILILPIRAIQAVFSLIVLGVLAYAANHWGGSSPSSVNFLIFTSVWTLLALIYLILAPARFPAYAHKYGILGAEFVTMIFWFAGFIALADHLSDVRCGSYAGRHWGPCRAAIAGDVFAAFEWVLFAVTTTIAALHAWKTRNDRSTKSDPAMEVHV
ncbi:hypothetical protein LZ554_004747 [Drepanopeziza brunnea f. sp. 'monogermtubi']|nr:hypothetical protein LZ554_004747 [Drepanopeziza brunnea f. sp. 'monogermtubi']